MSRGTVADHPVSRPLADLLPSIYHDGEFVRGFTGGLDVVLAPAIAVLDCLHAYVDPGVAPADFVAWLGGWVGAGLDEDWSLDRQRRFVATATELYAERGTVAGLRREIELYTDGTVAIADPGQVWTSSLPTGTSTRDERRPSTRTVQVTVDVPDGSSVNWAALQALIRDAVPAHLPVEVELRETGVVQHLDVPPAPAPSATALPPPTPADDDHDERSHPT